MINSTYSLNFDGFALWGMSAAHIEVLAWLDGYQQHYQQSPSRRVLADAFADPQMLNDILGDLEHQQYIGRSKILNDEVITLTDELIPLPLVGNVAAGVPIEAIEHQQGTLSVPKRLFSEKPTYLLRVRGDSMKDVGILDGDLIAVRKSQVADEGKIVVARVDGAVTVKQLKFEAGLAALMPANSAYQPIMVAPEELVIEGLFVGLIRGSEWLH